MAEVIGPIAIPQITVGSPSPNVEPTPITSTYQSLPFRPDVLIDGWSTDAITVRGVSLRGHVHRYNGAPRQDDFAVHQLPNGRVIVLIADGVSGAPQSHIGSSTAVRQAAEWLHTHLGDDLEGTDWLGLLKTTAWALTERAQTLLGLPAPDPISAEQHLATTLACAVIEPTSTATLRAYLISAGDSSAWLLSAGQFIEILGGKTESASGITSSAVVGLPRVPAQVTPAIVDITDHDVLLIGTDGVGDPLGAGRGGVANLFRRLLSQPQRPNLFEFAHAVDFSRETFDDDRTLVAIWPNTQASQRQALTSHSDVVEALASDNHTQPPDVASAASRTRGTRDGSSPRPGRHNRPSNRARPKPSLWRPVLVAAVILAVAVFVGGLVGFQLGRMHHAAAAPTAAQPTRAPTQTATPAAAAPPGCGDLKTLLVSMSTRDKLAQLLMVGVTDADDAQDVVAREHVGGIFIASWTNPSMLTDGSLAGITGAAGPLGLAVAVDEEGGRVDRLSSLIDRAPSARELAQTYTSQQVYQLALRRGRAMRNLGITIDFAPVVDVTDAPDGVIGDRSFSGDPDVVTKFAGAYAKGLRDAGVLPVLKHFPGHGHASGDSHIEDVTDPPLSELKKLDLLPYRTLLTQLPVGVMVAHVQVPGLTDGAPASLSATAIALLRKGSQYGGPPFNGPVFTDSLTGMRAITDRYGVAEAALKALLAGNDTALWTTTEEVPAVLDGLVSAVNTGELNIDNIDASVRRMARAKAHCGH